MAALRSQESLRQSSASGWLSWLWAGLPWKESSVHPLLHLLGSCLRWGRSFQLQVIDLLFGPLQDCWPSSHLVSISSARSLWKQAERWLQCPCPALSTEFNMFASVWTAWCNYADTVQSNGGLQPPSSFLNLKLCTIFNSVCLQTEMETYTSPKAQGFYLPNLARGYSSSNLKGGG